MNIRITAGCDDNRPSIPSAPALTGKRSSSTSAKAQSAVFTSPSRRRTTCVGRRHDAGESLADRLLVRVASKADRNAALLLITAESDPHSRETRRHLGICQRAEDALLRF